ncbi:uncharacterized protein LAJ45_03668 [Morchella importuna]|uniref:uncharacterized protein n=1 Tax=Morchella importuna TaxID=1174673 RepID=UPI001E8CFA08|nr:uncharacterized protein LAJ45_03668 [Morchella importuna]KAH8152242.1 hypothetical protein LAJ45_03668 [Morchella importuna]
MSTTPTTPSSTRSFASTTTSLGTMSPATTDTSVSSSSTSSPTSDGAKPLSPSSHDLILSLLRSAQSAQAVGISTALATANSARARPRARETRRPVRDEIAYGYLDDPVVLAARARARAQGARDKMEFEENLYRTLARPASMETLGTLKDVLRRSGLHEEGTEEKEDEKVLGMLNDF